MKVKLNQKILSFVGITLAILISVLVFSFKNQFENFKAFGYFGIFLVSLLGNSTIVLPIPSVLAAYLGGGIYNPVLVGVISAFGATIGELTGYMAGAGGRVILKKKAAFQKIENWMKKYGLITIFILAAIPNPLFDLAGMASGMLKIPVWKFFTATFLGKIIKFLIFAFLGAGSFTLLNKFV